MNNDESLVHAVLSAAEKPAPTASEVAHEPKFPPFNTAWPPETGRFESCDTLLPNGTSYENKRFPVATFFSIVTMILMGKAPAASKHVIAESDSQPVVPHAVWPKRMLLYSLSGCRCCTIPKPLPATVTTILPVDGRFGTGRTLLGYALLYSR